MCNFSQKLKRDFFSDEETLRCDRKHGLDADTLCIIHSLNPDKSLDDFAHEVKRSIQSASKKNSDGKQIPQVKLAGAQVPKGFRWADLDIASEQTQNLQLDLAISHFFADADFSNSQWQSILCQQAKIAGNTDFHKASIGGDADFREASIGGDADFREASIGGDAYFIEASIGGYADFREASIGGDADFREASIGGDADFREASIGGDADFREASIGGDADFREASIGGDAYFIEASIGGYADFREASIGGDADFREASIGGDAYFIEASIGGYADFREASIGGDADFREASIGGDADFREASIGGDAYFIEASIGGDADFQSIICMGQCNLSGLSAASVTLRDMLISELNANQPLNDLHIRRSILHRLNIRAADSHGIRLTNCLPYGICELQQSDNNNQSLLLQSWQKLLRQKEVYDFFSKCFPEAEEKTYTRQELLTSIQGKVNELSLEPNSELAQSIQTIDPSDDDARQKAITRLIAICPALAKLLLPASSTRNEAQEVKQRITGVHYKIEKFIGQEKKPTQVWDLQSRDLSHISFIECNLSGADFSSSNVANTYFDSCTWNKPSKRDQLLEKEPNGQSTKFQKLRYSFQRLKKYFKTGHNYDALHEHYKLLNEKTDQQKTKLTKLRNVYQRLKKNFEENHDYRQAGQFHYREMQIRQSMSDSKLDSTMLWLYCWIAAYGESYPRVAVSIFGFVVLFPALTTLITALSIQSLALPKIYLHFIGYYLFAVVPRSIGNAFSTPLKEASEKVDLGSLQWLLQGLEIQSLGLLGESLLRGSVVLFYITFFILLALLIMSVRRRYKR